MQPGLVIFLLNENSFINWRKNWNFFIPTVLQSDFIKRNYGRFIFNIMERHISAVHEERKRFKCKMCEKSFSYKSKMEKHQFMKEPKQSI